MKAYSAIARTNVSVMKLTMRNIVDAIQIFLVLLVKHVLSTGTNNFYRIMAEKDLAGRPLKSSRETKGYRLLSTGNSLYPSKFKDVQIKLQLT